MESCVELYREPGRLSLRVGMSLYRVRELTIKGVRVNPLSPMGMRFHPKRRAPTDQDPGPSSTKEAPRVPNRM